MNLLVLTRRRLLARMDELEKCASYGLIGLAFSDLIFCAAVSPQAYVNDNDMSDGTEDVYKLYYKLYGVAVINVFLMNSTWLIVYMAINRYIVVVYPFHARWTFGTTRTILSVLTVYVVSILLTSPFFFHLTIRECSTMDGAIMYEFTNLWSTKVEGSLQFYMKWIWPIVANFVPIALLTLLNVCLVRELHRANLRRRNTMRGHGSTDSSQRVTLTLVIIVLMSLLLVSPSEVLRYVNPFESWGNVGYILIAVTNVCQTLNFAFNFVLYCAVSASFRQTLKSLVTCGMKNKDEFIEMHSTVTMVNSTKKKSIPRMSEAQYVPVPDGANQVWLAYTEVDDKTVGGRLFIWGLPALNHSDLLVYATTTYKSFYKEKAVDIPW